MDWEVGQVLKALKENQVENNTLVFFTSDHGPHIELCLEGGNAAGLRGGKSYSSWEGGLRVPGIAYWPGTIMPGTVSMALVSTMDIFVTAVELAGGTLPTDRTYDGRSLLSLLKPGSSSSNAEADAEPVVHDFLMHYCSSRLMAVRHGRFKVKYFNQKLPLDDYATTHCTAGSPHGEFFQTWNCFGKGITCECEKRSYYTSDMHASG